MSERFDIDVGYADPWDPRDDVRDDNRPDPSDVTHWRDLPDPVCRGCGEPRPSVDIASGLCERCMFGGPAS